MMINTGLASITFRKLKFEEIIRLAAKAGLDGIEWGGDIHVPHGSTGIAHQVRKMTVDAGLNISSYGSYYYAGGFIGKNPEFSRVLETAGALQAPVIRNTKYACGCSCPGCVLL